MKNKEFEKRWGKLWCHDNEICEMVEEGREDELKSYLMERQMFNEDKADSYIKDVFSNVKISTFDKKMLPNLFLLSIGVLFVVMSLYFSNILLGQFRLGWNSKNWTPIVGTMLEKSIGTSSVSPEKYGADTVASYYPQGKYEFYYMGEKIIGARISFDNSSTGNSKAVEKILNKIPAPGEDVIVYYDERNHRSVLVPGTRDVPKWPVVPLALFFLIGVGVIKISFKASGV